MAKIAVKLKHPENNFKDDAGNKFIPHETSFVEETERIKNAIASGLLVRDREAEADARKASKAEKRESAPAALIPPPDENVQKADKP